MPPTKEREKLNLHVELFNSITERCDLPRNNARDLWDKGMVKIVFVSDLLHNLRGILCDHPTNMSHTLQLGELLL
jgi:hypothetical protein